MIIFCSEESFAALIGIIFIYEAFDKMIEINRHRPVRLQTTKLLPEHCTCRSGSTANYWKPSMTMSVSR